MFSPKDDSDSDWSAEDAPLPNIPSGVVGKDKPLQLSSDEDDDMFGPPSRNSEKVRYLELLLFIPGMRSITLSCFH